MDTLSQHLDKVERKTVLQAIIAGAPFAKITLTKRTLDWLIIHGVIGVNLDLEQAKRMLRECDDASA